MRAPLAALSGILCVLAAAVAAHGDSGACTTADAIQAETEASSLTTWPDLYRSYLRFRQCDDAAIAEGYSDSIARLLSDQWNTADELNRLVSHDNGFEKFVLQHIDELMSPTQAENIGKNAEARCPSDAKRLCEKITGRIKEIGA